MNRRSFLGALAAVPAALALPRKPSVIEDVQAMIRTLERDVAYGPYEIVTPEGTWVCSGWVGPGHVEDDFIDSVEWSDEL